MTGHKSRNKLYPLFTMFIGCLAFLIASSLSFFTFYITNGNGYFYIFYLIELNIIVPAIGGLLLSLLLGMKKEWLRMTVACVSAYLIINFFVRMILKMTLYNVMNDNTLLKIIVGSTLVAMVFTIVFGLIVYGLNKSVILWYAVAGAIIAIPSIFLAVVIEPLFESAMMSQTIAGLIPAMLDWIILGTGVGLGIGFVELSPQILEPYKIDKKIEETVITPQNQYKPLMATLFGLIAYVIGGLIVTISISFLYSPSDFRSIFVLIFGPAIGWLLLCLLMRWFSKLFQLVFLGAVGTMIELSIGFAFLFLLMFGTMGSDINQMMVVVIWFIVINIIYVNLMLAIAMHSGKINGPFRFRFYTLICGIIAIPFGILSYLTRAIEFWGIYLSPTFIIIISLGLCTGLCIGLSSRPPAKMAWLKK